jgi:hypothetical protein
MSEGIHDLHVAHPMVEANVIARLLPVVVRK